MQRVRARSENLAALALVLFLSSITTPHAGLYYHHHAGGDHLHVHLDGQDHDGDYHDHTAIEPHHHHHLHYDHTHLACGAAHAPVIEAPDDDGTGHWHSQDFFHRAVSPVVLAAQHGEDVDVIRALPKRALVDPPALPIRVRGPPYTA